MSLRLPQGRFPMCSCTEAAKRCRGQATVEGAFVIPIVFLLLLLLLQPGIVLYDRIVMNAAAAEGCRMLATRSSASGADSATYEEAIRRHLGAIPQQENFHRHAGGCSWRIELEGDEHAAQVRVRITGSIRLLPLLDATGILLGLGDGRGNLELVSEVTAPTQDSWVAGSEFGLNPSQWVGKWA